MLNSSFERDQAMAEKEAVEFEYIKLLSLKGEENDIREKAGDLADKCKYLEIDLETACVAGEAAHGQLLKMAYEKDVIILELEKAVQKLQENIRILEKERKADYKTWSKERQELIKTMDEIERHANEQLRQSLMGAQENISELIKLRKEDEILYLQQLKNCQMDWEMEREKLLEANNRDTGDRFAKLMKQNYVLKKRLKQSYQVLASITCDCNKLKEELKAKSTLMKEEKGSVEEAPADTVTSLERQCSKYGQFGETRDEFAVPTFYESKRRPLHLDMTHLAQRQMKLLDSLVAT